MRTIGFRASPKTVTFAIFDSESQEIITVDELKIPQAIGLPEQLKYVRFSVLDIIREFEVQMAGIREVESMAIGNATARIRVESVILEAFASSDLLSYSVGQIASIARWLGIPREDFNLYASGSKDWEDVENWGTLSREEKEAVLVTIGVARDSKI